MDRAKGTFEFRQVFPGSYSLTAFSVGDDENRIGGWQRIEVGDQPVKIALELKRGIAVEGRVQIEGNQSTTNPLTNDQIRIMLQPEGRAFGPSAPPAQVHDDGSFTMRGVVPGMWRIRANARSAFLKAAWLGSADVTDTPAEFSAGGALKIVLSMNTATIRGTAPAQENVMLQDGRESEIYRGEHGTMADQNGQYKFEGLSPGKYRLFVGDPGAKPEDAGQEVTVKEGETAVIDLKTPSAP